MLTTGYISKALPQDLSGAPLPSRFEAVTQADAENCSPLGPLLQPTGALVARGPLAKFPILEQHLKR